MHGMMEGLTTQMGGVREDIGVVRAELGARITEGAKATEELRKRLDQSEATFEDRVTAVVVGLAGAGQPGSDALQEGGISGDSYASRASQNAQSVLIPRRQTQEDAYWRCRRSLRAWPIRGPDLEKDF